MHEIKCPGNGLIIGISYIAQWPENLPVQPLPVCLMNRNRPGQWALICHGFVSKRSTHRHWTLMSNGKMPTFHGMRSLNGKRRNPWLWTLPSGSTKRYVDCALPTRTTADNDCASYGW